MITGYEWWLAYLLLLVTLGICGLLFQKRHYAFLIQQEKLKREVMEMTHAEKSIKALAEAITKLQEDQAETVKKVNALSIRAGFKL